MSFQPDGERARWAGIPYAGSTPILRPPSEISGDSTLIRSAAELAALIAEEFLDAALEEGLLPGDSRDAECTASYLILVLRELARPDGLARYEHYWTDTSYQLAERVTRTSSRRDLLALYRTNADYILLSLGLFDRTSVGRAGRGQGVHGKRRDIESRGTHYYHLASAQAEALYGREGELTRIMETLARYFPGYCHALRAFGSNGAGLVKRWTRGEEFHLLRDVEEMARSARIRRRWEHLLETYAAWKRRGTEHSRARLLKAAHGLEQDDPGFSWARFEEHMLKAPGVADAPGH